MESWYMRKEGVQQYCHSPRLSNEYIAWPTIKKLCGEVDRKKVLDLGTAGGETARKLAALGADCVGVDISKGMLQIADETTKQEGLIVKYLEGDCANLEAIPANEFDIIIMNFLLCNISSIDKINSIFQEAYRVAKPDGKVIFTIHHPLQLLFRESSLNYGGLVANEGPTNYFASGDNVKRILRTSDNVAMVHNFHWTIEDYIDSFVKAGFLVDAMKEPKPSSPPSEFADYFAQANTTPLYIVIRGHKK